MSMTGKKYPANEIQGLSSRQTFISSLRFRKIKKEISREEISNSKIDGLCVIHLFAC